MQQDPIVFTVFLVFTGAAIFATVALFARQSLLVAYIVLGALLGPSALGLVSDPELIRSISEFGIMFLLFLLGLNLQPQELIRMVRKTTQVTLLSSLAFFAAGYAVSLAFGFSSMEALLVGGAATFSSTIVGLKLLPTTMLHHQRTGEVIISILLLQDLLAIVLLLVVQGSSQGSMRVGDILMLLIALPALIGFAWLVERYLSDPPDPPVRQDSGIYLPDDHRLVSWDGGTRRTGGTLGRDRCLYRRRGAGLQSDRHVHRRESQASA